MDWGLQRPAIPGDAADGSDGYDPCPATTLATASHDIVGLLIGPIILAVVWELLTAWVRDDDGRGASPGVEVVARS
jgi:hypothetical protein